MRFIKKFFWFVVMMPLGVILATLMVVNRHNVGFVYNPFVAKEFAQKIEMPFFFYLLGALIIGTIIGGVTTWFAQGRWRKVARKRAREASDMRKKADELMQQVEMSKQALPQLPAAGN
jgi:heme/copper-type cytochrome/quinol oxidase subunit 1